MATLLKINKKEWPFILLMAIITALIIISPTIYAVFSAPAGYQFNGRQTIDSGDFTNYFSRIEQVKGGNIFYQHLFSSEKQQIRLFFPLWLIMGLFALVFGLSAITAFYILKVLAVILLVITLYFLIAEFFTAIFWRRLVLAMSIFITGSDWLFWGIFQKNFNFLGLTLNTPETHTLTAIFHSPHLALSLILLLWIFIFIRWSERSEKMIYSFWAGLCGLVLFTSHPYQIIPVALTCGSYSLYLLFSQKQMSVWQKSFLPFFVLSCLSVGFVYYEWQNEPILREWSQNAYIPTLSIIFLLVAYFPAIIFSFFGLFRVIQAKSKTDYFLFFWLAGNTLSIFLPISWQARMILGLSAAVGLLAGKGLEYLFRRYQSHYFKMIILWLMLALSLPSGLYLIGQQIYNYKNNWPEYYLASEVVWALKSLKNLPKEAVILAPPQLGNFIPAYSGRHVYLGHLMETLNFGQKFRETTDFYINLGQSSAKFLEDRGITHLVVASQDPLMRNIDFSQLEFLMPVFSNQQISVYQVLSRATEN